MRIKQLTGLVLGSIGPKRGKELLVQMLLEAAQLPRGKWSVVNQRVYRTRARGRTTSGQSPSKGLRTVSVWRCYRNDLDRISVSISILRFKTNQSALSYLPVSIDGIVRRPFSKLTISNGKYVMDATIDNVRDVVAYEEDFAGPGGRGTSRVIAVQVDCYVVVVECSGFEEVLSLESVKAIASDQADKVRTRLENGSTN